MRGLSMSSPRCPCPVFCMYLFLFWNLQDQKVHRYVGSSQLGTSRNQPLCSTPEMSNTRYHSRPDAGQRRAFCMTQTRRRAFCMYLSVEACLSPSLPFAVFALRLVGCDNVCCSSLVLSIPAGSGRFPAVNSQSIYVPFGLVNSKKKIL